MDAPLNLIIIYYIVSVHDSSELSDDKMDLNPIEENSQSQRELPQPQEQQQKPQQQQQDQHQIQPERRASKTSKRTNAR